MYEHDTQYKHSKTTPGALTAQSEFWFAGSAIPPRVTDRLSIMYPFVSRFAKTYAKRGLPSGSWCRFRMFAPGCIVR